MRLPRLLILLLLAIAAVPLPAARAQSVLSETFAASNADLSPEARAGREIWMFATAFNDRFFTYSYPQRIGGRDRLVRVPARRPSGRAVRGLGRDTRPRLLRAGRRGLPGPVGH